MLRLTLRSGRDGRFLARVIDRDGFAFVLDYGDRRIIQDASQRLLKGFTMWRSGRLITATPQDPDLLGHLAEFYVREGLLVFLEEPTWAGREGSLEDRLPGWSGAVLDEPDEAGVDDDNTDLVSLDELERMKEVLAGQVEVEETLEEVLARPDRGVRQTWRPLAPIDPALLGDLDEDDLTTELAPLPLRAGDDDVTELVDEGGEGTGEGG